MFQKKTFTDEKEKLKKFVFNCKCGRIETEESNVFSTKKEGNVCLYCYMRIIAKRGD